MKNSPAKLHPKYLNHSNLCHQRIHLNFFFCYFVWVGCLYIQEHLQLFSRSVCRRSRVNISTVISWKHLCDPTAFRVTWLQLTDKRKWEEMSCSRRRFTADGIAVSWPQISVVTRVNTSCHQGGDGWLLLIQNHLSLIQTWRNSILKAFSSRTFSLWHSKISKSRNISFHSEIKNRRIKDVMKPAVAASSSSTEDKTHTHTFISMRGYGWVGGHSQSNVSDNKIKHKKSS